MYQRRYIMFLILSRARVQEALSLSLLSPPPPHPPRNSHDDRAHQQYSTCMFTPYMSLHTATRHEKFIGSISRKRSFTKLPSNSRSIVSAACTCFPARHASSCPLYMKNSPINRGLYKASTAYSVRNCARWCCTAATGKRLLSTETTFIRACVANVSRDGRNFRRGPRGRKKERQPR